MLGMLIFAAATASSPSSVPEVPPDKVTALTRLCRRASPELVADGPDKPVRARKMNELPNANAYLAVLRSDAHGCTKPAIIAYDIGSAPRQRR